MYKVYHISQAT